MKKKPYLYLEIVFYLSLAVSVIISLVHLINSNYTSLFLRIFGVVQMAFIAGFVIYQNKSRNLRVPKKLISYLIFTYLLCVVLAGFIGIPTKTQLTT